MVLVHGLWCKRKTLNAKHITHLVVKGGCQTETINNLLMEALDDLGTQRSGNDDLQRGPVSVTSSTTHISIHTPPKVETQSQRELRLLVDQEMAKRRARTVHGETGLQRSGTSSSLQRGPALEVNLTSVQLNTYNNSKHQSELCRSELSRQLLNSGELRQSEL